MRYEAAWSNKTAWKLYKENWKLCHQIVDLRDGRKCQMQGCKKTELDLDHGITRKRKIVYFDIRHLGYLCRGEQGHHANKSFRGGDWVDKTIDQIHIQREGQKVWEKLLELAKSDCPQFRTVMHQEKVNIKLKEQLSELLENQKENV